MHRPARESLMIRRESESPRKTKAAQQVHQSNIARRNSDMDHAHEQRNDLHMDVNKLEKAA